MKKSGTIILWVVVGIVVFIAAFTVYNKGLQGLKKLQTLPSQSTTQQAGTRQPLPTINNYEFTLSDLNGKNVKLSDYKGKVIFLNFWATWCPYCVQELPDLDKANKELLKGNDALIITVDEGEKVDTVKNYLTKNNLSLPVLMDFQGAVGSQYRVNGIPATFVFGKDGSLYKTIVGPTTESDIINIANALK